MPAKLISARCCIVTEVIQPTWAVATYRAIESGQVDEINSTIWFYQGEAPTRTGPGTWEGELKGSVPLWLFRLARPDIDLGSGSWSLINLTPKVIYTTLAVWRTRLASMPHYSEIPVKIGSG